MTTAQTEGKLFHKLVEIGDGKKQATKPLVMFCGRRPPTCGDQKSLQYTLIINFSRALRARSRGGRKVYVGKVPCFFWFPMRVPLAIPRHRCWSWGGRLDRFGHVSADILFSLESVLENGRTTAPLVLAKAVISWSHGPGCTRLRPPRHMTRLPERPSSHRSCPKWANIYGITNVVVSLTLLLCVCFFSQQSIQAVSSVSSPLF